MRGTNSSPRVVAAMAVVGFLALAGCAASEPMPVPTPSLTETAAPAPTGPAEPQLDLGGTATENLPYFDQVNRATVEAGGSTGRVFIDGLVAAGFPKDSMEVTPDRTAINLQADNVQFSVRLNGTCLVGAFGNAGYGSIAAPLLGDGRCLIGTTLPIDW